MITITSIKGMKDILPTKSVIWQYIENKIKMILYKYFYLEIRTPIMEKTHLFNLSLGQTTDIIKKEMYTFNDKNNISLTLRPENTTSIIRSILEHHSFFNNKEQKLWYVGPMFRYENPQHGRYRQFHQFGVETFNMYGPDIDSEIIFITNRIFQVLGIKKYLNLELNSLGSKNSRRLYSNILFKYFKKFKNYLDTNLIYTLYNNPLRLLDNKINNIKYIFKHTPKILDFIDIKSLQHFDLLKNILTYTNIKYTINTNLVRGLDYYSRTVFEWTTTFLGSQNTICAGGRYDYLIKYFHGKHTPAIGFAIGLERIILLLEKLNLLPTNINVTINILFITLSTDKKIQIKSLKILEQIRNELPNLIIQTNYCNTSLKKQLYKANKNNIHIILFYGSKEFQTNKISIKDLYNNTQKFLEFKHLIKTLKLIFYHESNYFNYW
ncbi:Histidine--tRNA ligase [Candidatus Portiera aleyrodidarum]|uniref:Histidine--tRNA ligase n=1 Tax=Candidatus Portiera aleyrodidarum TV TaxID=1297582 RepID=A0A8D3X7L4_9GAMM|nr:histidine--tRNA ligase [Candidatus Portiera aleyrodidarum]AGI27175.1 histidyl-tRNA synthetase [Candidatus Portiera aleyrodidarum TV]CEI59154.1 Histidine--tRNA ligase [Candidatus Portiera aleyrodidarum]